MDTSRRDGRVKLTPRVNIGSTSDGERSRNGFQSKEDYRKFERSTDQPYSSQLPRPKDQRHSTEGRTRTEQQQRPNGNPRLSDHLSKEHRRNNVPPPKPDVTPRAMDFLTPSYNHSSRFIESRSTNSTARTNGVTPAYLSGDGLALPVPIAEHDRMRKSSDKHNLRRLIDTKDPHFPGLKRLKFRGKELSQLPQDVFSLKELELLDLSPEREACLYYKLPSVPPSINRLVNLKVLILDTNELVDLPPEIGQLSQLEHLALSNNSLSMLPEEITKLARLNGIHLANNKFTVFPEQLVQLRSLMFLDLSDNEISRIPKSIKNLTELETLIMFANQLRELPDELCDLMELRMLWVGDNYIRILPRNFGKLRYLDWDWHYTSTTLDGNPLEHPPMEICKKGMKAIDDYLERNWAKIERGEAVYTPNPIYVRDKEERRQMMDTGSSSDQDRYDRLDVDPRMLRNMRRGSIPIPSSVPDGLAAMDSDR